MTDHQEPSAPHTEPDGATGEKVRRLELLTSDLKHLCILSGNRCAFPKCHGLMIRDGVLVGEVAHIEAANIDGPRFNASSTNEDRRALRNLMLLCRDHHKIIDTKVESYSVADLIDMKQLHEDSATNPQNMAQDLFVRKIHDVTTWQVISRPTNMERWRSVHKNAYRPGDLEWPGQELALNDLIKRIAAVSPPAREVLALIVKRGQPLTSYWDPEVTMLLPELADFVDVSDQDVMQRVRQLERRELVYRHEDDAGYPEVRTNHNVPHINNPQDSNYQVKFTETFSWVDLKEFCEKTETDPHDLFVELRFDLLQDEHQTPQGEEREPEN